MTPPATVLSEYRERTSTTDRYLGRIVMMSQREATITQADLAKILAAHDLSNFEPSTAAPADVFRRVSSGAERRREPVDGQPDLFVNLLIRSLASAGEEIIRRLVVETVDAKGKRLSYDGVIDVEFRKDTNHVTYRQAPDFHGTVPQVAWDVAKEIRNGYAAAIGLVDPDRLRRLTQKIVEACHGVKVRDTGGVYFTPRDHSDLIERLTAAAEKIPGCQVDSIKLVDEGQGKQRDMVQRAADADISAEATRLIIELQHLNRDGAQVSTRKAAAMRRDFLALRERATAHEQLLEQNLDESRIRLGQLEFAISDVISRAA